MIRQALELKRLTIDPDMNPRDGLKQEVITNYAEDMRGGAVFPPLVVYNDGETLWLSEGFHRVYAAYQAGLTELEAEVRIGTRQDAWLNAIGSNATHGAQRTKGDTKKAIEMAYRYLMEEGEDLKAIPNTDIAKLVKVSEKTVRNVKDEVLLRIDANSDSPNDQKIKQPPVQTDPTAEIDRLQKDLNKAVEMATAAEAKAAELYKAREKIRLETEARAKAEKELQTFRAEMQKSQEEEIARRLEELKQTLEPVEKIVEKQVAVEDPATAFRLKKAEEQRDKYEMELKKIQQEGRDWRRLEDKKSKLELEIDKLQMRALEKRAETTLMAALDNVEHSRYISDRIHDMCQRGEMTLEQLDNAERTMTAMVNAGNDCLVVIRAEREGLVKAKGGLRVVE